MRCVVAFALCTCALVAAERPQVLITTSLGEITAELFAAQAPETVATFIALAEGGKAWKDPATGASVTRPFYDGLTFHRVIDGFMIQGGCPLGNGQGGPGFSFADEINARSLGLEDEKVIVGDQPNPQCAYMWPQIQQAIIAPALSAKGMGPQTPREQLQPAVMAEVEKLRSMSLRQLYERLGYTYRDDLPPSTRPLKGHLAMANSGPATNGSQFFINLTDTPHLTGKHTVFGKVVAGLDVVEKIGAVATGPGDKPRPPVVIESIRLVEGE